MPTQAIQDALALLHSHNYKCYRPYTRPEGYDTHEDPDSLFVGKVIDCEANGLAFDAKVFELGVVLFEYDQEGRIYRIRESKTMFEDIGEPLLEDVKVVTGRSEADFQGKRFDDDYVAAICAQPGIFIAHNATYDRPKLEKRFPLLTQSAWGCSLKDIDWMRHHVVDKKLRLLAMDLGGFHFHGHQAEDDCLALLEVLTQTLPGTEHTVFQRLLARARQKETRLYAIDAPFEMKELLKSAGFVWHKESPKAWYIDLSGDIEPMKRWLREQVYPYPVEDNMFAYAAIDASNRHSSRIMPEPAYLRHRIPFGKKFRNRLITEVAATEPEYLEWALREMQSLEPDLRRTFEHYLAAQKER